jgi:hypothetical protein
MRDPSMLDVVASLGPELILANFAAKVEVIT